jgi:hypothetical protein
MLEELVNKLVEAKAIESQAKANRIEIEEQIAQQVQTAENGSKTITAGDKRVTIKRAMNYKVDLAGLRNSGIESLPLKMIPAKPVSYEFDNKLYEALVADGKANELSEFIEAKPAKVSVTVKLV